MSRLLISLIKRHMKHDPYFKYQLRMLLQNKFNREEDKNE